jgi:hypothetical protein
LEAFEAPSEFYALARGCKGLFLVHFGSFDTEINDFLVPLASTRLASRIINA